MDNMSICMEPNHPNLSLREQAKILGISRSSFYYKPKVKQISSKRLALFHLVDETYTKYPFMGTRQMSDYISMHHYPCSRYDARCAYEQLGLRSSAPSPNTSKPNKAHDVYPYLLKNLDITRPQQVFSSDITYIRMPKGFVYLTAIIDWYSRFVLDWQLSINLNSQECNYVAS